MKIQKNTDRSLPGVLISIEGGEGSGKTTQTVLLEKQLREKGFEVIRGREPGGTKIGEQIREVVLSPQNSEMVDEAEVFLYQASRAQLFGEVIIPALEEGKIVLMDRTGDSSVVYQGIVRGFGSELIQNLNEFSMQKVMPDLTFLLDIAVEEGFARLSADRINRIEMQGNDFHQQVRAGYLELAQKNEAGRWRIVDAVQSVEEVNREILTEIEKYLAEQGVHTDLVNSP